MYTATYPAPSDAAACKRDDKEANAESAALAAVARPPASISIHKATPVRRPRRGAAVQRLEFTSGHHARTRGILKGEQSDTQVNMQELFSY